jgi:hypothetical protein
MKIMNESNGNKNGYVYILEVKDIDLPVCKIGMTSRSPHARCSEINKNSTGDFIWQVVHQIAVNDCQKLESLVHKKLEPLRQKNREFFNIYAEVAYNTLRSILENQSEIMETTIEESNNLSEADIKTEKKKIKLRHTNRKFDPKYAELLQSFTSLLGIKGRPFGQFWEPLFGISDGNEGVQWNLAILTDSEEIHLGVNLEGMKYLSWPIASFILSELEKPNIEKLKTESEQPERIFIQFMRNAWQITARPDIVEKYIGGRIIPLSEMDSEHWNSLLTEALGCLDEDRQYRGRKRQQVTFLNKPKNGEQTKMMEVSPHLTIWTPINLSGDSESNLKNGFELLKPVHEWVTNIH